MSYVELMNNSVTNFKQELNRCMDIAKSEVDRSCSSFTSKCNVIKTVSYSCMYLLLIY